MVVPSRNGRVAVVPIGDGVQALSQMICAGLTARGVAASHRSSHAGKLAAHTLILVSTRITPELLGAVRSASAQCRTIGVLGEHAHVDQAGLADLMRSGVHDILIKDHCDLVGELAGRIVRWEHIDSLIETERVFDRAIGRSHRWVETIRRIVEVAHFTDDTILLHGASGTGKDLLARLIHDLDRRSDRGRYVILDCTTVHPELAGSELFGHERGAFTGAVSSREGVFAEADHGTLFLDEVGDLPLPLQAQLLRVIQEGTYRRVGSNIWYHTNFRLVCATNRNLADEITAGRFRRDLYYRIAQWTFELPSLSERTADIPLLIRHFLSLNSGRRPAPVCDILVERFLQTRSYPGNVRELRSLVERLCLLQDHANVISAGCIPADEWANASSPQQISPGNGSHTFIHDALNRALGLKEIEKLAKLEAIKEVMTELLSQADSDSVEQAEILAMTARRLQCSLRWIQKCNHDHALFETLTKTDS